ncbi:hypothetical protein D9M68_551460 [compost metagenome]
MINTLNKLGFTLTDQFGSQIQYSFGKIDVFVHADHKAVLAYDGMEIMEIRDEIHLYLLIKALTYDNPRT